MTQERIFNQFHQELFFFIQKYVKDQQDAQDILQDVFLKIMQRLPSLKETGKLKSWLYQITYHTTIDFFRKQKKQQKMSEEMGYFFDEEDIQNTANFQNLAQCLHKFTEQLPEPYREALVLAEFDGIKQKDIAQQLNISYATLRSRVQRGRNKLKEMLLECCAHEVEEAQLCKC